MGTCFSSVGCLGKSSAAKGLEWATIEGSPIDANQIDHRTEQSPGEVTLGGKTMQFGVVGFRGFYPDEPYKENQDKFAVVLPSEWDDQSTAMFGVFDGHGSMGDKCADFAMKQMSSRLPVALKGKTSISSDVRECKSATKSCFVGINQDLHKHPRVDDTLSGTTAICVVAVSGDDGSRRLMSANVGDSRAIIVFKDSNGNFKFKPLSVDQTPYRQDERIRIREAGGRVLNVNQLEGHEPIHDNWNVNLGNEVDEYGDPPRVWRQDQKAPGTAFTRSIGDSVAEELGVFAEPEFDVHAVDDNDMLLIVASDGVWEFLTNETVKSLALSASSCQDAAIILWQQSFKEWTSKEYRTDDITVIVVDLNDTYASKRNVSESTAVVVTKTAGTSAELGSMSTQQHKGQSRRGSTKMEVNTGSFAKETNATRRGSLQ